MNPAHPSLLTLGRMSWLTSSNSTRPLHESSPDRSTSTFNEYVKLLGRVEMQGIGADERIGSDGHWS